VCSRSRCARRGYVQGADFIGIWNPAKVETATEKYNMSFRTTRLFMAVSAAVDTAVALLMRSTSAFIPPFRRPETQSSSHRHLSWMRKHRLTLATLVVGAATHFAFSAPAPVPGFFDGQGSAARFNKPSGIAVDQAGNVYVTEVSNNTLRKIDPTGMVTTLAGQSEDTDGDGYPDGGYADGLGSAARFNGPSGLAIDTDGNLYVADTANSIIRKVTPAGDVTTLAGRATDDGSADGVGNEARFKSPEGVAVDRAGNVYVGDTGNATIRRITPTGEVTTLAGLAGNPGDSDGTGSAARFDVPCGVTVDASGVLYVADLGNSSIRKISPGGVVTTLAGLAVDTNGDGSLDGGYADGTGSAARFNWPYGVAADSSGNVYVTDGQNDAIRRVSPSGLVETLAGRPDDPGSTDGLGSVARFRLMTRGFLFNSIWSGLGVDAGGNLYVADAGNHVIRRIAPNTMVTTLAGLALDPVQITRQPRSRAALLGETVTLNVLTKGTEPRSYQWFLDGQVLPAATNSTLTVSNLTLANLGAYEVLVRNPGAFVMSQPAALMLARWNELVVFDASISFQDASNGKSWVEWFGEKAGLSGPNQIKNRATGGATGADVRAQIKSYLNSNKPGTNTLIAPWYAGISADLAWNYHSVGFVVSNYLANLTLLAQGGGKVFLLPTLVPLHWNPIMNNAYARGIDYADMNARMDSGIAQLQAAYGLTIHRFDFWGLCSNIFANPATYGFTNVVDSADQLCPPGDPNKFLWWDGAHPTTAFHRWISDATYRSLTEPLVVTAPVDAGNGKLVVRWQGGSGPFRLQHSDDLAGSYWESGDLDFVTSRQVPVPSAPRFFRVLQLGQ